VPRVLLRHGLPAALTALAVGALVPALASADEGLARFRVQITATQTQTWEDQQGSEDEACSGSMAASGGLTVHFDRKDFLTLQVLDVPGRTGRIVTDAQGTTRVRVRRHQVGVERPATGCGCGPNSELGPCPPPPPNRSLRASCEQEGRGLVRLAMPKTSPYVTVQAPVDVLLEDCEDTTPYLGPTPPPQMTALLPRSAYKTLMRMRVGQDRRFEIKRQTDLAPGWKCTRKAPGANRLHGGCQLLKATVRVRRTA
jgi:hypothetical protein